SHDRRLLQRFARSAVWLDRGITRMLDQGFATFEAWRDAILEQETSEQHKLGRKIAMEEDWLRYGVTARRTRNQRRLAELHTLRRKRREHRGATGTARLEAAQADLSGRLVAAAASISKAYGDNLVVRNFSVRVMRGDRVGIVGPNGAGKTTLLNLLTGVVPPDAGKVRLGTNLVQVTLDQRRESLDPEQSLAEALTGGSGDTVRVGGQSRHVIGYMKDFLFRPEQARTPVGVLSGGERARLTLARAFARPSNLLVLDEPTNDLDLETLDLLQEQLAEYPGTVLLVSHDRDFLDRVVTSTIATDGNGRWVEYAGGYTDMLAQRAAASRGAAPPKTRKTKRSRPATQTSGLPGSPPRRMNFNDRRALDLLPARIGALEARITELNAALADADLYRRNPARFRDTTEALAVARDELAAAEEQWLRLEMLREEIEEIEPRA
ncbi:MAG: ATP-binding cassette domain-containing protein, partial [Stellaceae bacterium]